VRRTSAGGLGPGVHRFDAQTPTPLFEAGHRIDAAGASQAETEADLASLPLVGTSGDLLEEQYVTRTKPGKLAAGHFDAGDLRAKV
jgi:hypothetical protein